MRKSIKKYIFPKVMKIVSPGC